VGVRHAVSVDHHADTLRREHDSHPPSNPLRDEHDALREFVRDIGEVVDVLARDDGAFPGGEGTEGHECHDNVVLIDDARWSFACYDFTECACHYASVQLTRGIRGAGGVSELSDDVIEIEIRVNVRGKGDSIEEDRQTLRRAELPQHFALMEDFRADGRTRLLECRNRHRERGVEIGKLDLEISEIDFAGLAQLRATARDTTEPRFLESGLERIFVSITSIHGFDMLVQARDDQVRSRHE